MSRQAREIDLLDRVAVAHDAAVNRGLHGRPLRHRPQSDRDLNLTTERFRPRAPLIGGAERRRERGGMIEIDGRAQPRVRRQLGRIERAIQPPLRVRAGQQQDDDSGGGEGQRETRARANHGSFFSFFGRSYVMAVSTLNFL
jgi:hypothetical protein